MIDAIITICTRLQSRRLPGKALMNIEGMSSLEHIITRIEPSNLPLYLCVPEDQATSFFHLVHKFNGASIFKGNAESPLHRIGELLRTLDHRPKYIIRITHDDILIDCKTMMDLLECVDEADAGYGSTPSICEGAGVEIIRSENILKACSRNEPTEFISYFVKGEGMPFPGTVKLEPRPTIKRNFRLTLDYPQDALVLKIVLRALGPTPTLDKICQFLDSRPYILNLNRLPDVSFYTCAKDMERWIGDTMLSVLGSNLPSMEYIVVDDGSRDNTLAEIAKFSNDKRLTLVINEDNEGLASSCNTAIAEAKGKTVVRIDADDMLRTDAFNENWPSIKKLLDMGHKIVYPAYYEISQHNDLNVVDGMLDAKDPRLNHHAGGAIMDRAWLNEWRFKDGLRHWDGLELYNRANDSANPAYFDNPIWLYRIRNGSLSRSNRKEREVIRKMV